MEDEPSPRPRRHHQRRRRRQLRPRMRFAWWQLGVAVAAIALLGAFLAVLQPWRAPPSQGILGQGMHRAAPARG